MKIPAAQYLRMSTENQQYSLDNQSALITEYARTHGFEIIQTYSDEARSGLTIAERPGLRSLIEDITVGRAEFSVVLVLDVSRWGRFQDVDEAAHYEFLCKLAGIKVHYCAETFSTVEGLAGSLLKALKRSMAAEYSRELSTKTFIGQCRIVQNGFKIGGAAGYGLRRLLLDSTGNPKAILRHGEQKSLTTEHVIYALGTEEESRVVRNIYAMFLQGRSVADITRQLNLLRIPREVPGQWNSEAVRRILIHPKYMGCIVYNRTSSRLHTKKLHNPPQKWVVNPGRFPAIIPPEVFMQVQGKIAGKVQYKSNAQLLEEIRGYVRQHGYVSTKFMRPANRLASNMTYRKRFGSLRKLYELIPYKLTRNFDYQSESKYSIKLWAGIRQRLCSDLGEAGITFAVSDRLITFFEHGIMTVEMARFVLTQHARRPRWRVNSRPDTYKYPCLVLRLNPDHATLKDCCLFPKVPRVKVKFSISEERAQDAAMIWNSTAEMATFLAEQEPRWLERWAAARTQAAAQSMRQAHSRYWDT